MRWNDYQKQIRRRRRPMKQDEKVDYDDQVTNEYEEYEIIQDSNKDNTMQDDNNYKGFYSVNNNNKQDNKNYKEEDKQTNSKFYSFNKKYNGHDENHKGGYKGSFENENKYSNQEFQGFHSFKQKDNGYEEKEYKGFKGFNKEDTSPNDPLKTIEKLFKGDNQMLKDIIETIGETGILDNFKEPLGIIERVYGPLLDGNTNQHKPPMWAYNKANRRIKHMQRQNANKQLHSEMYNVILKQVKDLLVNSYGSKVKGNMPMLFDDDDE